MMAVHNEVDILQQNLNWYHDAGFPTVILDNGSTDGSSEICTSALKSGKILAVDRFETQDYEWDLILDRLTVLAQKFNPDWLMLTAPDEFFETASGENLKASMEEDIASEYNLIKFFNMEFWMTERDDLQESNPLTRMRYYSYYDVKMYRAFPNIRGIDIKTKFSHQPVFPSGMLDNSSPRCYISRHYKLRNFKQASYKISRIKPTSRLPLINTHYLKYSGETKEFIVPSSILHYYKEDNDWNFVSVYDGGRSKMLTPVDISSHENI